VDEDVPHTAKVRALVRVAPLYRALLDTPGPHVLRAKIVQEGDAPFIVVEADVPIQGALQRWDE
jgi:hypothetical protein